MSSKLETSKNRMEASSRNSDSRSEGVTSENVIFNQVKFDDPAFRRTLGLERPGDTIATRAMDAGGRVHLGME